MREKNEVVYLSSPPSLGGIWRGSISKWINNGQKHVRSTCDERFGGAAGRTSSSGHICRLRPAYQTKYQFIIRPYRFPFFKNYTKIYDFGLFLGTSMWWFAIINDKSGRWSCRWDKLLRFAAWKPWIIQRLQTIVTPALPHSFIFSFTQWIGHHQQYQPIKDAYHQNWGIIGRMKKLYSNAKKTVDNAILCFYITLY